jgi:hypothetical protein
MPGDLQFAVRAELRTYQQFMIIPAVLDPTG